MPLQFIYSIMQEQVGGCFMLLGFLQLRFSLSAAAFHDTRHQQSAAAQLLAATNLSPRARQGLNYVPVIRQHGPLEGLVTRCGACDVLTSAGFCLSSAASATAFTLLSPPQCTQNAPHAPRRSADVCAVQNTRLDAFHVKAAMAQAEADIQAGRLLASMAIEKQTAALRDAMVRSVSLSSLPRS